MPLAQYRKAAYSISKPSISVSPPRHSPSPNRRFTHLFAPILVTIGSLMITTAVWPIVQYQFILSPSLQPVKFLSPLPESQLSRPQAYRSEFLNPQPQVAGLTANGQTDTYTNPRTWFPEADFNPPTPETNLPLTEYLLSIPKVNIESARVVIDGEDLSRGLIQYPGTAMPGQPGSTVIFGHSVLRQFYNPSLKNPNRYMSIFSKIMTLKTNDQIYLDFGDIRYTYEVKDKVEAKPEDVFILEQRYGGSDLKLITCVPEGTYLRRGVVIAGLISSGPVPQISPSVL